MVCSRRLPPPRYLWLIFVGPSLARCFAGAAIGRRSGHFARSARANGAAHRGRGAWLSSHRRPSQPLCSLRWACVSWARRRLWWTCRFMQTSCSSGHRPPASAAGFISAVVLAVCLTLWLAYSLHMMRAYAHLQVDRGGGRGPAAVPSSGAQSMRSTSTISAPTRTASLRACRGTAAACRTSGTRTA